MAARWETLIVSDCTAKEPGACVLNAFVPPLEKPGCLYTALVTDTVTKADGTTAYVHLMPLVLVSRARSAFPKGAATEEDKDRIIVHDEQKAAVLAAVFFDQPGLHDVCFETRLGLDNRVFQLFRASPLATNGEPIEVDDTHQDGPGSKAGIGIISSAILLGVIGNKKAGALEGGLLGTAAAPKGQPRIGFFNGAYEWFQSGVGCVLTGCPEKVALRKWP